MLDRMFYYNDNGRAYQTLSESFNNLCFMLYNENLGRYLLILRYYFNNDC